MLYLLVAPMLWEPVYLSRSIFFGLWTLSFILYLSVKNKKIKIGLLEILFGFFVLSYIISAFINRQNPIVAFLGYEGRHMGLFTLMSILAVLILVRNSNLNIDKFLTYAIWPIITTTLIYGYIQKIGQDPLVWAEIDRTVLTLGNSDFAAQLLAALLVVPLYYIIRYESKLTKILNLAVFFMLIDLGLYTQAFQFRVVGIFTVIVFLSLVFRKEILKVNRFILSSLTLLLLSLASFYTLRNWDALDLISRTGAEDRIDSVKGGLSVFKSYPIFGVGIEQLWRFDPEFRPRSQALRNGPNVISDKAHNVFVDHLANGGIFAGVTFLLFVFATIMIIINAQMNQLSRESRLKIALVSAIWLSYVLEMFITTDNVFIMALSYVTLSLLVKHQSDGMKPNESNFLKRDFYIPSMIVSNFSIVILVAGFFVGSYAIVNSFQYKQIDAGKITDGNRIVDITKGFPNQKGSESIAVSLLSNTQNCPLVKPISENLLQINPRSSQALYFLAICADAEMNQEKALEFMNRAVQLQPLNNVYMEAQLRLQVRLNRIRDATNTYEKMVKFDSTYPNLSGLQSLLESSRL